MSEDKMNRTEGLSDYQTRVAQQIAQYESVTNIHDLPPISYYWSNRYVLPKLEEVMGATSVVEFYVSHIAERIKRLNHPLSKIISLGAGNADLEIQIASELLAKGVRSFVVECTELSPILIERANRRIQGAQLSEFVRVSQADLNAWEGDTACTAILASHVLHHVVELESLFVCISRAIGENGVFLTHDMIGRNGHMRWPEALSLINLLWPTLSDPLKYNSITGKIDTQYIDVDCSTDGFEGIRAQDILPLLNERFKFEKFLGFGNLTDIFTGRLFGPNFSIDNWDHISFIDNIEQLNELFLEVGVLKPTKMFSVLSNKFTDTVRVWGRLTPQYSIRSNTPCNMRGVARSEKKFTFAANSADVELLKAGWSFPESWGTWMSELKAEVVLDIPQECRTTESPLEIMVEAIAFLPKNRTQRDFLVEVNGCRTGWMTFKRREIQRPLIIRLPSHPCDLDHIALAFTAMDSASPADDGSPDTRLLGLGLTAIRLR